MADTDTEDSFVLHSASLSRPELRERWQRLRPLEMAAAKAVASTSMRIVLGTAALLAAFITLPLAMFRQA